jgi:hypothetical protein
MSECRIAKYQAFNFKGTLWLAYGQLYFKPYVLNASNPSATDPVAVKKSMNPVMNIVS